MQKRVSRWLLLMVAGVLALTVTASATTVVGSAGAGWQAWSAPNEDGTPYWDNTSSDGAMKNIGYFLSKTGGFSAHPDSPAITPPWWGYGGGGADSSFYFSSPLPQVVKLVIEVAGAAGTNQLWWYEVGNPTNEGLIFAGSDGAGTIKVVSIPVTNFGLRLVSGSYQFYTQSALNSHSVGSQKFALFQETPGVYWLGIEDKPDGVAEGTGDYNDMVIRMTAIPEPATMSLFALGLLPLLRRRKA